MLRAAALALASLLLAAPAQSQAPTEGAWRTVQVVDADTLILPVTSGFTTGIKIRLAGVDAPEHRGACDTERAMAIAATDRMRALVSRRVRIVSALEVDAWGRVLARVYDRDGRDVAAVLIAEGLARPLGPREARKPWC